MKALQYVTYYPVSIVQQHETLIRQNKLKNYLLSRYPNKHGISNEGSLYDSKLQLIKHGLGTHALCIRY